MNRWIRLGAAVTAMIMIANLQVWLDAVHGSANKSYRLEAFRGSVWLDALHCPRNLGHVPVRLDDRQKRSALTDDDRRSPLRDRMGWVGTGSDTHRIIRILRAGGTRRCHGLLRLHRRRAQVVSR